MTASDKYPGTPSRARFMRDAVAWMKCNGVQRISIAGFLDVSGDTLSATEIELAPPVDASMAEAVSSIAASVRAHLSEVAAKAHEDRADRLELLRASNTRGESDDG